jgi:hypothetical protein
MRLPDSEGSNSDVMTIGYFSCKIRESLRVEDMDEMHYTLLTEVLGRGTADVIESFLRAEEIDVVLVQEAISHVTHITSFAPVKIYVPKASIQRARTLLKMFNESQDDKGDREDGQ